MRVVGVFLLGETRVNIRPGPEWIQRLAQATGNLIPSAFYGRIEITFKNGRISNVAVTQTFKQEGTDNEPATSEGHHPG